MTKSALSLKAALAAARTELVAAKAKVAELKLAVRAEREAVKADKVQTREAKRAAAIAKAQARLDKLLNPAGSAARKAARKPGPVTITKFSKETQEANVIAANIKARKATA